MTSPARGGPDTAEWWAQLFHATQDAVDGVLYAAGSEYPVPHIAAFRAAAEPLLLPVVRRLAVEKAAEAVAVEAQRIYAAVDAELQDAPSPNYEEDDYAAGYIAGLTWTAQFIGTPARRADARADALAAAAQPADGRTGE